MRRLSEAALRASRLWAGFRLGSACDAAEGAEEVATCGCEGSSGACAAGPSGLAGPRAADDMRLCHCVVAPDENGEVAGGLAGGCSAPGSLTALAASGRGAMEDTLLCHWVVAPEGLRMEGDLESWEGLGGASTMTLASGMMEETRLCHWVVAPEGANREPARLAAEGEGGRMSGLSASSWATEETCLCHCVVAPEGVYRGAAGSLAGGGGSGALRGDHWAAADFEAGEGGGDALLACALCCSLSRRWAGGCRGWVAGGVRSTSVRSITRPPLPTRWMWALACCAGRGRGAARASAGLGLLGEGGVELGLCPVGVLGRGLAGGVLGLSASVAFQKSGSHGGLVGLLGRVALVRVLPGEAVGVVFLGLEGRALLAALVGLAVCVGKESD